jgi:hypothetical protein
VAGPILALGTYLIVARQQRNTRSGLGAAALVGLIWFVVTAEWQPPAWSDFWNSHSLAASVITSVLAVGAGWFFLRQREASRRLAALLSTWRQWVEYQRRFVAEMIEQRASAHDSVLAQQVMTADISSRLVIQQQWIAALFVITAMRSEELGTDLMVSLGELRDKGAHATREFAQLEALLDSVDAEYLPTEAVGALWNPARGSLAGLLSSLDALKSRLGEAHWEAQAKSGEPPTHPLIDDVDELKVRSVKTWSPPASE